MLSLACERCTAEVATTGRRNEPNTRLIPLELCGCIHRRPQRTQHATGPSGIIWFHSPDARNEASMRLILLAYRVAFTGRRKEPSMFGIRFCPSLTGLFSGPFWLAGEAEP